MKPRHVVFSVGLSICIVFEMLQTRSAGQAVLAAAIDGLYLGVLFYGLLWVCKQVFCQSKVKEQKATASAQNEPASQRAPSRVTYIG